MIDLKFMEMILILMIMVWLVCVFKEPLTDLVNDIFALFESKECIVKNVIVKC